MNGLETIACGICGEPVTTGKHAAELNGKQRIICRDCAEGIHIGTRALMKNRIVGVFQGICGDNQKGGVL